MSILFTFILLAIVALAWLFYDKFTKRGAIPLSKAFKDYTAWWGYAGVAFADFIVDWLRYLADAWEPLHAQFGDLLSAPSLAMAVKIISGVFLLFKLKGQSAPPKFELPPIPSDTDKAGA